MEAEFLKALMAQGVIGVILALLVVGIWKSSKFLANDILLPFVKSAIEVNKTTLEHLKSQEKAQELVAQVVGKMAESLQEMHLSHAEMQANTKEVKEFGKEIIVSLDRIQEAVEKTAGNGAS